MESKRVDKDLAKEFFLTALDDFRNVFTEEETLEKLTFL